MSSVQLRRLTLVVVVLLGLWGASALFSHRSDQTRGALVLPALPAALTDTITIVHSRDTVRLAQVSPHVWTANGFPAAPGKGDELLKALGDTAPRDVASINQATLNRMGLDTLTAWMLRVGPGRQPRFTLLLGNPGEEYGTAYVRLPRSDTAYLWRGTLPALVQRAPDIWRDHHIASVAPDSIQSIEITLHGKRFAVTRQGKGWTVDGQRADSTKVGILLAQYRNLEAQSFGTRDSLRTVNPRGHRVITIRGKSAAPLLSLVLDSATGWFWATKVGDSTRYKMPNYSVLQLTPAADSLRARH
jgi:hypothetical protein